MSSIEERNILEDLEKKGFSIEVDIADLLVNKGWLIYPQYAYHDMTSRKIRTVDLLASYPSSETDLLKPQLVIDCKKCEDPWIFGHSKPLASASVKGVKVRANAKPPPTITFNGAISGFDLQLLWSDIEKNMYLTSFLLDALRTRKGKSTRLSNTLEKAIDKLGSLHYSKVPNVYSCHVAFRKPNRDGPDDFTRAIYQIKSAFVDISRNFPKDPVFGAIVLRGKMFLYEKQKGQGKLTPCKHVVFYGGFLSKSPQTTPRPRITRVPVLVDVVADTQFREYLNLLDKDVDILRQVQEEFKAG